MAIFTPRGLKIFLDNRYCFALMQRLYPKTNAFKVLKTTDGFECLKDIYVLLSVVVVLFVSQSYWVLGISVLLVICLENIIERFSWVGLNNNFITKLFLKLSILFSYIYGFFIYTIVISALIYFTMGLYGLIAYFLGIISAEIIKSIVISPIDMYLNRERDVEFLNVLGTTLTKSERNFFNSYLFHSELKEFPLIVNESELNEENWKPVYTELKKTWPMIINRITWD